MKSENADVIRYAFTAQAADFETDKLNFSRKDYLDYVIKTVKPEQNDSVLETAAGTCLCGRALAPFVNHVTCLDMTPAMLAAGKTESEKAGFQNMSFVLGDTTELPFLDNSFDLVLSRLAFHHFSDPETAFYEMNRVLKPGGRLILIDMEAAAEYLRKTKDMIERLRDPSHVRSLSRKEILSLYETNGLDITFCETMPLSVDLQSWLELTKTPRSAQEKIRRLFTEELAHGAKTGFEPYLNDSRICFRQNWTLVIGRKG